MATTTVLNVWLSSNLLLTLLFSSCSLSLSLSVCVCVCVCLCAWVPKALLPKGNGRYALTMGAARRVGPDTEPKTKS